MWFLRRPIIQFSRQMSTLQRNSVKKVLLAQPSQAAGRRLMGHGPDISGMEAFLYILIGGGGFAAWGMYKTFEMRDRIEAFETGQIIPFRSLSDEQLLEFRKKFKSLHAPEDEDEEGGDAEEEAAQEEQDEESYGTPQRLSKSSKDTVIFVSPD